MHKPRPIAALQNTYETGQVSLAQWNHVQGEVNDTHKLDRHYYGLFGFLACNKQSIEGNSSNTASSLRIHRAVKWLKGNNHLYASFFTKFETLFFFYAKPDFINPELLEDHDISL